MIIIEQIETSEAYGEEHLCTRCFNAPRRQVLDHGPSIHHYKKDKERNPILDELIVVSRPMKDADDGLCYYCHKVITKLFKAPEVSNVRQEHEIIHQ
jgi:hypothetical protein